MTAAAGDGTGDGRRSGSPGHGTGHLRSRPDLCTRPYRELQPGRPGALSDSWLMTGVALPYVVSDIRNNAIATGR